MNILNVCVTVALIALLLFLIVKKMNPSMSLMLVGIIGLVYFTIVNGSAAASSTGSLALDIFAYIESVFASQLTGNILILGCVMAYVEYLEKIKATRMLCLLLAKPLQKLKSPYILLTIVMIVVAILKWVIFSNAGQAAIVIATLYPILMALGVTRATAASAIAFATYVVWGPSNGITFIYWGLGNVQEMTVADYFIKYELINIPIAMVVSIAVFIISSKIFDKKENAEGGQAGISAGDTPESLGIPKWYAIFPLLPVVMVIVCSSLVLKTVILGVTAACIICWVLLFVIEAIRKKSLLTAMQDSHAFWVGFGNMVIQSGCLVITAAIFAGVIGKIGGLNYLFTTLMAGGNVSFKLLVVIGSIGAALFAIATGNMLGAVSLFGAILAGVASSAGVSFVEVVKTLMPITCVAATCSPVSAGNLFIAGQCDVDIMVICKRCVPPLIAFIISTIVVTVFIL